MSVPLAAIALGHRNRVTVDWHGAGDEYGPIPVVEIARHRLGSDGQWEFVGSITVRASNDIAELAAALATAARFAATWKAEHGG